MQRRPLALSRFAPLIVRLCTREVGFTLNATHVAGQAASTVERSLKGAWRVGSADRERHSFATGETSGFAVGAHVKRWQS
jgi:hypothetical protein